MSAQLVLIMFALSVFGAAAATAADSVSGSAKNAVKQEKRTHTTKSSTAGNKKKSRRHIAKGLIPPPPAYMPSILPELYLRTETTPKQSDPEVQVAEKPVNPYARYFYSRQGDVPKATTARSGVTTWSELR
jgi:hypothetical protein